MRYPEQRLAGKSKATASRPKHHMAIIVYFMIHVRVLVAFVGNVSVRVPVVIVMKAARSVRRNLALIMKKHYIPAMGVTSK